MNTPDQPQPRIPGVRYRKVNRERPETTVINGIAATRQVKYQVEEPVPPRDWDELILRAVFIAALAFTLTAIATTATSFGRLLSPLLGSSVAYTAGAAFASGWLICLGLEWLDRDNPDRARAARNAGWFVLAYSMAAVLVSGHTHDEMPAAAVGAWIDVMAKVVWWLLFRQYAVPLPAGTAHWLRVQEQDMAARARLGVRFRRLDRRAAYQQAVGGRHYEIAGALLAHTPAQPITTGQAPAVTAAAPARPHWAPDADTAPGPSPDASGQASAQAAAPARPHWAPDADTAPGPSPDASGQASAQAAGPARPHWAPDADTTSVPTPDTSGQRPAPAPAQPPQLSVVPPSLRQLTFQLLDQNPHINDDELITRIREVHGEAPAATIERYRRQHASKSKAS